MNKTWIKYAGVLVLGILLGLAGGAWTARQHFFKAAKGDRRDPGQRIMNRLDRELKLTADQRAKVENIFEENRKRMEALRTEVEPKFESLRKTAEPKFEALKKRTEDSIRQVLTPEQAAKYDQIKSRWDKKRSRMPRPGDTWGDRGDRPPPPK